MPNLVAEQQSGGGGVQMTIRVKPGEESSLGGAPLR